jgi:putative nucleotidyltransferase with HDIG domain
MIDYEKAKKAFDEYLKNFDINDGKVQLKLIHTYGVVKFSELIAKDLQFDNENVELAKLIALLHDIGRFEQARVYNDFRDYVTMDHADYGVKLLFEDGMIRSFIETDKYDDVIYKAIKNHNKYKIEDGLSEYELLHSKVIRDADKIDNFRVKETDSFLDIANIDQNILEQETITDKVYMDFMNHKTIISSERKNSIDAWVSYVAFVFDLNFRFSFKYIKDKNYVTKLLCSRLGHIAMNVL